MTQSSRKPVIGIAGGIGSGKSFVARMFGELGCLVISSDDQVKAAYHEPKVKQKLREWWGPSVFRPDGTVDRSAVAAKVFADPVERQRLERLLHPLVNTERENLMRHTADNPSVVAYIWDTPLLFETGLNRQCDAVVFVEAPEGLRRKRVMDARRWEEAELARRENLQWPLDTKREMSDSVIGNTADAEFVRGQVRETLSRILARSSDRHSPP
jgi:dephospho-CoA kinase